MIEAVGLTKRYGSTLAVNDLSFSVRPGVVTGFLGPNGAGKSTTMRMILGLDTPTSGRALIDGAAVRQAAPSADQELARCWTRTGCIPTAAVVPTCASWPRPVAFRSSGSTRCSTSSG